MLKKIKNLAKKNRGAVLVEYVIILAFIAALAVAIGLNDDSGLKGAATTTASNAKTDLTNALGGTDRAESQKNDAEEAKAAETKREIAVEVNRDDVY